MRGLNLDANNDEKNDMDETKSKHLSDSIEGQAEEESIHSDWELLEKELYLKGIEMFGRNRYKSFSFFTSHLSQVHFSNVLAYMQFMLCSCLIAKNILFMMKTCSEVARYMYAEVSMPHGSMDENGQSNAMCIVSTIIHFISPSPLCFCF